AAEESRRARAAVADARHGLPALPLGGQPSPAARAGVLRGVVPRGGGQLDCRARHLRAVPRLLARIDGGAWPLAGAHPARGVARIEPETASGASPTPGRSPALAVAAEDQVAREGQEPVAPRVAEQGVAGAVVGHGGGVEEGAAVEPVRAAAAV